MGKLAKPQRSKKHKKIKAVDPFYVGSRKDVRSQGWNQKPKCFEQEVPKKLKHLGFSIDGVKSGRVGKKSKNKFLKFPDAPHKYNNLFSVPLGTKLEEKTSEANTKSKKTSAVPKSKNQKRNKRDVLAKVPEAEINNYIDNLKASRPFVEPFQFKQQRNETDAVFMRRVDQETRRAINLAQINDKFEVSDEKKILKKVKSTTGMSDKKKQRLKEKKKKKVLAKKEKKQERFLDFGSLQDKVEFGDVVSAPPNLSVRPKKSVITDLDRPGMRMPELRTVLDCKRKIGKSQTSIVDRQAAGLKRQTFVDAYRQLKKSKMSAY